MTQKEQKTPAQLEDAFCIHKGDPLAWTDPALETERAEFVANFKEPQHTATPWLREGNTIYKLSKLDVNHFSMAVQSGYDDDGKRPSTPECEAIAESMRFAINAHDDLVESVKRLLCCMSLANWEGDSSAEFARAALAKAGAA